ncbi:MAG: RNA-guided endonuclease InsQ/TnpB family protein, partial [Microcystaceae cyanobacterium]
IYGGVGAIALGIFYFTGDEPVQEADCCRFSSLITGTVKTVTISKTPEQKYFVSVLVDDGKDTPNLSTEGKAIGIDVGLLDFAVTSDGSKFSNPKHGNKHYKKLKRRQQKLAQKQKGSNNRAREGKVYLEVDRFFPSSKTCNKCLHVIDKMPLDIRHWRCPKCETQHDRDINAARNIRDEALRILRVRNLPSHGKCKTHSRQAVGRIATAKARQCKTCGR